MWRDTSGVFCGGIDDPSLDGDGGSLHDDGKGDPEDAEDVKVAPDPGQPSEKEMEEHRTKGHYPYRAWCKWCVWGRAVGTPHTSTTRGSRIPRIG